jgi:glycerophosphoryl diester phosphodiesterase
LLADIDRAGMRRRVTIQSFDWRTLALVGELAPGLPRAYLTTERTLADRRWTAGLDASAYASTPRLVKAAAGPGDAPVTWSPAGRDVTATNVREAHALGLRVVPWTINRRADMARLMALGVDGLITDFPDVLREEMGAQGLPLPASVPGTAR